VSSVELADLLGVHLNTIWNWTLRRTGPPPEPDNIHVRASNRRFFLPAIVLEWLSTRDAEPIPAWTWCQRWINTRKTCPIDDQAKVANLVLGAEQMNAFHRKWRVRLPAYMGRLRSVLIP
jgi:hypothetical protein